jgi:hypothetical protein
LNGALLALSLVLLDLAAQPSPVVAEQTALSLTIDECLGVDPATVRQVMELEMADARLLPASVSVRCVDGTQEIRIKRSDGLEDVRRLRVAPASGDDSPAQRQARSRELALSIAEFLRWPGLAPPPAQTVEEPAAPPLAAVPEPAKVTPPVTQVPEGRWQLGILYALESFSRGNSLMGADLFMASRLGRWYLVELRIGGRLGGDVTSAGEQMTTRAAAVAAAAGVNRWSKGRAFGGALALRAQGYLAQFRGSGSSEGRFATSGLGAVVLAVEPRLMVAVTDHLLVQVSAAAGRVLHGIVVRIQGLEANSISGFALSANLAGVLRF